MRTRSWLVRAPREPMVAESLELQPTDGEVVVAVAGCGVCHTDLGFFYEGVPTRHALPLALGHEVSGTVVETGTGADAWLGRDVVVPAVLPCGTCEACRQEHGSICPQQVFPGNDVHGGFGTHLCVPGRGLCPVPDLSSPKVNPTGIDLALLSVVADAVSTPYQAILQSGLRAGDVAVFVGVGGVGGFGVQIAAALGAHVAAVDVCEERLALMEQHGASLTLRADQLGFGDVRKRVRSFTEHHHVPTWRQRIFETSGTPAGQATAFGLLGHGGHLSIVGYTPEKVELRLSNLMALHATAAGTWGCLPAHYPAVVDLVLSGKVALRPFVEKRPLETINQTFEDLHAHRIGGRVILIPKAPE